MKLCKTATPRLRLRGYVRDGRGRIKCDSEAALREILAAHRMRLKRGLPAVLSAEDINHLREVFGNDNVRID